MEKLCDESMKTNFAFPLLESQFFHTEAHLLVRRKHGRNMKVDGACDSSPPAVHRVKS